jgi:PAS domain S-box-containing protein
MRQILEYSNEPVTISLLSDHKLVEVNAAFLKRTGYTRKEVIGRSSFELGLWVDESVYRNIGEELSATGAVRQRTIKYKSKNGEIRVGHFSAAIRQFDGQQCVVSFITDTTESVRAHEELRRSERRFRSYIEHASDGLTVLDQDGRITFTAPSVERLLGFSPDQILGKNLRDLIHPEDLETVAAGVEELRKSNRGQSLTFRVQHRRGHWIFVEGTATVLPETEDEPGQTVVNWRDITQRKLDEERLHNIERRLRDIIGHSPIIVTEFDRHGTIIMAEGRGVRMGPGAIGKSMLDLLADVPPIIGAVEKVLSGEPVSIRVELQGRWFDVWAEPVVDTDGSIKGGISVSTEITNRVLAEQHLEQEREQFRVLVENATDVILMLGRDGTILFASPSVEKHTGFPVEDLLGTNAFTFVHPDDRPLVIGSAEDAFADRGSTLKVRFRLQNKAGEVRSYESTGKVLPGQPDRLIVQARDVTEQERYETDLASARDAALESSRLKSAFLANMSHEIRTPLNVILGYVDVIEDHLTEIGDDTQQEYLDAAARAGKRLIQTINGILDYSKIEAGGVDCKPEILCLSDLVARQVADFQGLANRNGVALRFLDEVPGACIIGDEYCISSSVQNVIGNAIKFTAQGSVVVRQFQHEGKLCLEVRDTGVGIDCEFLPKLFQPFVQEDSGFTRKYEGSGLGLALTKRFLDANHARISVTSEQGLGAVFTIHFSTQCESSKRKTDHPMPEAESGLPRLLLVEDDLDTQTMMQTLLHNTFDLQVAPSGDAVREIIALDSKIEGVLMDISLKGEQDGFQITRFLRSQARFRSTPIIAVTAHASVDHQRMALEAGCDTVLTKPVKRLQIMSALNEARRREFNSQRFRLSRNAVV